VCGGKGPAWASLRGQTGGRTQSRRTLPPNLARVNAAAHRADQTQFTALLHHIDRTPPERAFRRQKRQASEGIDGITVEMYERTLDASSATGRRRSTAVEAGGNGA
jgi:RNA-directed DNA polymerase